MDKMDKKDYEEPRCPMDNSAWVKKKVTPISADRVIAKEDEYLSKNDYAGAERHLLYWWREAEAGNDDRGKLVLCNELMGLYRKLGKGEMAKDYSSRALGLVAELGLENTVSGATAFLNSGTVYKAFGEPEKSLGFFEKARSVYENEPGTDKGRLAGLYNNMALTLADLHRYSEAKDLYNSAIGLVRETGNRADEAITWLNIADLTVSEKGIEESDTSEFVDKAEELLDSIPEAERDGYYAYVCDKCAPVFDFYGRFLTAEKYRKLSAEIYGRNK